MSGPRYQFAPGVLRATEDPLEGEPRWDAIKRRIGFYNFETSDIDWFRIPGPGENENYVPEHEWDGSSLRFREPDGSWGPYVDVGLIGVEVTNDTGTPSMRFTTANGMFEVPVEIKLLDDDPNNPVNQSLIGLYFHLQKLLTIYAALDTIERVNDSIDQIDVLAANIDVLESVFGARVTIQQAVDAIPLFEEILANKAEIVAAAQLSVSAADRAATSEDNARTSADNSEDSYQQTVNLRSEIEIIKNTLLSDITAEGVGVPYNQAADASYDPDNKKLTINIPAPRPPRYSEITDVPALVKRITTPAGLNATDPDVNGVVALTFATDKNLITQAQTDKLAGIAPQATKNQTDSYLLSRTNHTGLQEIETISGLDDILDDLQSQSERISNRGVANGYATLDSSGKLTYSEIPESLLGGMNYKGAWDASTNTPTIPLSDDSNKGWYYIVSVAGTTNIDGITDWEVGDWLVSSGEGWDKIDSTDQVMSVNGMRGAVVLGKADVGLDLVDNTSDATKPLSTPAVAAFANRLRIDAAQGLNATQIRQGKANLGIASFIDTLLAAGDAPTARAAINAQNNLGFAPVQQGSGINQGTNKVIIGWSTNNTGLRVQVDTTDLGRLWNDFAVSFNTGGNGYMKFPNGFMIEWGRSDGNNAYVTFPAQFPNYCFTVSPGVIGNTGEGVVTVAATGIGQSGFSPWCRYQNAGGGAGVATQTFGWIAVGW